VNERGSLLTGQEGRKTRLAKFKESAKIIHAQPEEGSRT
jgi:hypothetical protein